MNSEIFRIAELIDSGDRRSSASAKKAFLAESRGGRAVRYGITTAVQLLGCSANRIRTAEEDGRLPPPSPTENHRRPCYSIKDMLNMRDVLGSSPACAPLDTPAIIAV